MQKNEWFAASGKVYGENHCRQFWPAVPFLCEFAFWHLCFRICSIPFVKKCWKQECKKQAVRSGFSRLWDVRIVICSDFWGPGALFGEPGVHCEDFWDCFDFWGVPATKNSSHFETNLNKFSTFCGVIFWCFFECLLFRFFVILGAWRLNFSSHFQCISGVLDLWKNS